MPEIKILYRDKYLAVAVKPIGVSSEDGMSELIKEQLGAEYVGTVHRLDKNVGGIIVYSLDKAVTGKLTAILADKDKTVKEYLAVLCGKPEAPSGTLTDLLFHDTRTNKTFVVDRMRKGVKEASLGYETLAEKDGMTLARVRLFTGRTHQIRVQFGSRGLALRGDGRYGGGSGNPALFSYRLTFPHPVSKKTLTFTVLPDADGFRDFDFSSVPEITV